MSEWDVFNWLKDQRHKGQEEYYSVPEITKGINEDKRYRNTEKRCVRRKAVNMMNSGFLENKLSGSVRDWHMRFRIRDRYL